MLYTNNQENNSSPVHIQLLTRVSCWSLCWYFGRQNSRHIFFSLKIIILLVQVRPLHATDHVLPTPYFQVDPARGTIILGGKQLFQFDYVLPFDCPQEILYKGYVETRVNACFEGINQDS